MLVNLPKRPKPPKSMLVVASKASESECEEAPLKGVDYNSYRIQAAAFGAETSWRPESRSGDMQ